MNNHTLQIHLFNCPEQWNSRYPAFGRIYSVMTSCHLPLNKNTGSFCHTVLYAYSLKLNMRGNCSEAGILQVYSYCWSPWHSMFCFRCWDSANVYDNDDGQNQFRLVTNGIKVTHISRFLRKSIENQTKHTNLRYD